MLFHTPSELPVPRWTSQVNGADSSGEAPGIYFVGVMGFLFFIQHTFVLACDSPELGQPGAVQPEELHLALQRLSLI